MSHEQKMLVEKSIYEKPHLTEGTKHWGYFWDQSLMHYLDLKRRALMRVWAERYMTNKTILVLGAGFSDVEYCLQFSANVTAVDISELQVERIRQKFPSVKAVCADLTMFTPGKQYEVLYCSSILHHLVEDFDGFLNNMSTWIIDGGIVFIQAEPLRLNPMLWFGRKFFPSQYHTPNERPFILSQFNKQVSRHFNIVYQRCDYFFTLLYLVATQQTRLTHFSWFRRLSIPVLNTLFVLDRILAVGFVRELYWLFGGVLQKKSSIKN